MGDQFRAGMLDTPEAREALVRNLMDEAAVTQTVAREHVGVSEQEAVALIKNADALKENGQFSPASTSAFLQSQGKSDQQFVLKSAATSPRRLFSRRDRHLSRAVRRR